jgi:hypothetical protein
LDTRTHDIAVSAPEFDQYARFLLHVVALKGYPGRFVARTGESKTISVEHRTLVVVGFDTCLHYLCERFPVPDLTAGDVVRRTVIRMQANNILDLGRVPEEVRSLPRNPKNKFFLGPEPTLIDVALISVTEPDDPQFAYLHEALANVAKQSQRAA